MIRQIEPSTMAGRATWPYPRGGAMKLISVRPAQKDWAKLDWPLADDNLWEESTIQASE